MGTKEKRRFKFEELFDIHEIQRIQDEVAHTMHTASIIVEPDGTPITRPSNFCSFCYDIVRSSPIGCANCQKSDAHLGRPNPDGPIISSCLSANLMDAGCSIIVDGEHVASWMLGQVRDADKPVPHEDNIRYAKMLGVDPDRYCEEYEKLPAMSHDKFAHVANLIFIITAQFSRLAEHNIRIQKELDHRIVLEQQLRKEHERLAYTSTHDSLTGAYNRSFYEEKLDEFEENKERPVTIVMGDLNNLKIANDIFGHKHGDLLLQTICSIMQDCAEEGDMVCRCGGDEFVVIMPHGDTQRAKDFCARVKERCAKDTSNVIKPSISFGYDSRVTPQRAMSSVLRSADSMMYKNKQYDKLSSNILMDIQRILTQKGYFHEDRNDALSSLTVAFGVYLKLDDPALKDLNLLCELRDIGWIIVPDALRDAQTFTDDDIAAIHSHATIGYRLAKLYDNTYSVAKSILHHHENFDGSGYPDGLTGTNIPYLSRIVAITETYLDLISEKPDGQGLSVVDALTDLYQKSGTQFDPELVKQFTAFISSQKKS